MMQIDHNLFKIISFVFPVRAKSQTTVETTTPTIMRKIREREKSLRYAFVVYSLVYSVFPAPNINPHERWITVTFFSTRQHPPVSGPGSNWRDTHRAQSQHTNHTQTTKHIQNAVLSKVRGLRETKVCTYINVNLHCRPLPCRIFNPIRFVRSASMRNWSLDACSSCLLLWVVCRIYSSFSSSAAASRHRVDYNGITTMYIRCGYTTDLFLWNTTTTRTSFRVCARDIQSTMSMD